MPDRRCFVQFPHPGGEHEPDRGGKVGWNKLHRPHKRKFMRLRAEWIDENGNRHSGDLHAWGEWEPESEVIPDFVPQDSDPHAPRHLWRPYWIPRNTYRGLHNTDPFIFGERFLYSNCGQAAPSKAGLKRLGEGSVIAFGSGKMVGGKRKWVLDTVLVIKDSIAFDPLDPRGALAGNVPDAFLSVTGGPLADDPKLARKPVEGASDSTRERRRTIRSAGCTASFRQVRPVTSHAFPALSSPSMATTSILAVGRLRRGPGANSSPTSCAACGTPS